tara:strand:+ start:174 stop:305 length:132 start_codon:yes stop_codon:yes gene_type:complete
MKKLRRKFLKLSSFFSILLFTGVFNLRFQNKKKFVWYLKKSDK